MAPIERIFGLKTNYKPGLIDRRMTPPSQNFLQASVSANQKYDLNRPAQKNFTPYGDSPRAAILDYIC